MISTYSVTEANNLRLICQLATKRNYKLINTYIVHSETYNDNEHCHEFNILPPRISLPNEIHVEV